MKQQTTIGGRECLLYTDGQPQVLLIQTLGGHEHNSIDTEVELIRKAVPVPFVMAAFAIRDWEAELTPWHDPEVSKRTIVGELAGETLLYLTDELIPYLRKQYGTLPIVLGGYSLGGLFSLWAASQTDVLTAVAAMSPSLWIANWAEYSTAHPVCTQYVYLSLGDREEFTRNRAVAQVGNNVRAEYARLTEQLGTGRCTLEWNPGNHFADGAIRTAKGFAWCLSKLKNNPVSNEI